MKQNYLLKILTVLAVSFGLSSAWAQVDVFNYTGSIQTYVVPPGAGSIQIETVGAQGGNSLGTGGFGATMRGDFDVTPGQVLEILVGQQRTPGNGGGGGTFVVDQATGEPLIIAGGGGGGAGACCGVVHNGVNASITENGTAGLNASGGTGAGGTGGNGGAVGINSQNGGAGGGFYTAGANGFSGSTGGQSYLAGGAGGTHVGGYGGGGGSHCAGIACAGGGGGGYSGGGSTGGGGQWGGGGGGGSFNDGMDQVNTEGLGTGDGLVTITVLCSPLIVEFEEVGVCLGEELTLEVSSGTGGTISWSGGITNGLPFIPGPGATTYTATSSSPDDCEFSVEVYSSPVPDIEAFSSLPAACEGALITLWGEGGDTYEWSGDGAVTPMDSVAFLAEAGIVNYTLDGSFLGCHAEPIVLTLEGAPQPNVIGEASPSDLCVGESYTITGTGTGAESYYWGGGIADGGSITPAAAGTFIHMVIGVSDAGCYDTNFVTVNVRALPSVNAGINKSQCEGLNVTLAASGAADYVWTPAIEDGVPFPALPGETVYSVTGTNEFGCEATDEVTVTGVLLPEITAVVTQEYALYAASIDLTVTGGSGSFGYVWSHGPITQDVYGLSEGSYFVVVNDVGVEDGVCPDVDSLFTITRFVGVDELEKSNLLIYPNPTNDLFTITLEGNYNYEIYSIHGEVIISGIGNGNEEISLAKLPSGTYLIDIVQEDKLFVSKIVKE